MMQKPNNFEEYASNFPVEIQERLESMRNIIKKSAPEADEVISYAMPAFKLQGVLVYFAAYKNHIGFYPTGSGISAFKEQLSVYKGAKGSVQFPHDKPFPIELIEKIVKFRVNENLSKKVIQKKK
jgi:uncharacterized protein YdhG (YjbR/CyaY superfamily)